ncbi:MAG: hypothetical protein R2748_02195 [Bryobacterales bacterium]
MTGVKKQLVWVLLWPLIPPAAVAQKLDSGRIAEIQALIEETRGEAQVPGLLRRDWFRALLAMSRALESPI